jgi:hypothetical protein
VENISDAYQINGHDTTMRIALARGYSTIPPFWPQWKDISSSVLIFLKQFDSERKELTGIQSIYIEKDFEVGTLVSQIAKRMGWIQGEDEFVLFKEDPFAKLDTSNAIADMLSISDGGIVWFWKRPLKKRCMVVVSKY